MNFFQKSILITLLLCSSLLLPQASVYGQKGKAITWSLIKMDSTWTPKGETASGAIIAKYKPTIDPLTIPIGYSVKELTKYSPESPLSNWTADVIFQYGQQYLDSLRKGETIDLAITNFGGIRTSLPAGEVTAFDILSIFPFDNRIVILDLPGKYLRELLENFARQERVEALSGVEMEITDKQLKICKIGGKDIDDNTSYQIATIDFLLGGGDKMYVLKHATRVIETGTILMDAVIAHVKNETAHGRKIDADKDGRVVINSKK